MTIVARAGRADKEEEERQEKQSRQHRAAVAAVTAVRTTAAQQGEGVSSRRGRGDEALACRGKWSQC